MEGGSGTEGQATSLLGVRASVPCDEPRSNHACLQRLASRMLLQRAFVPNLWSRELTSNIMVASPDSDCPAPGASEQTCLPDGCLPKESSKSVACARSTSARRNRKIKHTRPCQHLRCLLGNRCFWEAALWANKADPHNPGSS